MSGRSARSRAPVVLIAAGLLLLVGALASFFLFSRPAQPAPVSQAGDVPFPKIERVSLPTAKEAFDSGSAVFVDVRPAESYALDHIPGARSIPLSDLEANLGALDPGAWIITS